MTLTPYRANLFQDHKELYQLLCTSQQQAIKKNHQQIISISQEISQLDPLVVFQDIDKITATPGAKSEQRQFYLENINRREAVAAIDTATSATFEGTSRFDKARKFINTCLKNTIIHDNLDSRFSGPHFFCSFTFFADKITEASPFPAATIFLPKWQISQYRGSSILVANITVNAHSNLEFLLEKLHKQVQTINCCNRRIFRFNTPERQNFIKPNSKNTEQFKSSVISALKSIQAEKLSKIVLASAVDVISPMPFNLVNSLDKLRRRHPDCYIFSTSNGQGQNFIGASPERLITIDKYQLTTDALAGSAPRGKTAAKDAELANRLLCSEKERREHQFVLDFITERLSELGLIPQLLTTPQLRQLSNIQHLWTPIQAQLPTNVHPLEIVAQLHPTPAVAGVPTKIAQEQIRRYETFDRCLYAAPLGWVDHQDNCEFIVGIRSALIESEKPAQLSADAYYARLYAGAGIVAGSDANKELAEIKLKLQALLKALL
ncbi:isochorismate synthase [Lyngbya aestuarii]|uniref:isochorismate synthase n=1 Tax=Lyngbya aestuarii TaxID=118322 RepID=UPI00403E1477